jgi:excisionase family DNA binding protein
MEDLTFNQLYQAIVRLAEQLDNFELVLTKANTVHKPDKNVFLTIKDAAKILNLAVPTVYGLVHYSAIPYNKRGQRLYFSEEELLAWIKAGRRSTVDEIKESARQSLYTRGNRKRI